MESSKALLANRHGFALLDRNLISKNMSSSRIISSNAMQIITFKFITRALKL